MEEYPGSGGACRTLREAVRQVCASAKDTTVFAESGSEYVNREVDDLLEHENPTRVLAQVEATFSSIREVVMKPEMKEMQEERFRNAENMEQRYRNWAENMASLVSIMTIIGQETGGEEFLRRVEEVIFEGSKLDVQRYKDAAGISETETEPDCLTLGKLMDAVDDSLANFSDGYVEKSPEIFEKRVLTCPVADALAMAPVVCERIIAAGARGYLKALNPKAEIEFTELMPRGDDACRYRIEIQE